VTWPDNLLFYKCVQCGELTDRMGNVTPMDEAEANSALRHAAFEVYYADYCAKREQSLDGPLASSVDDLEKACSFESS
jgi:hypothetical protein